MKELGRQPGVGRERFLTFLRRVAPFQNQEYPIAYAGDFSIGAFRLRSHSTNLKPRYQITTVYELLKLGIIRFENFNQILLVFEQRDVGKNNMIALTALRPQVRKH